MPGFINSVDTSTLIKYAKTIGVKNPLGTADQSLKEKITKHLENTHSRRDKAVSVLKSHALRCVPGENTYRGDDQQLRKVVTYTNNRGKEYHKVFRHSYDIWSLEKEYTLKNGYLHSFNNKPAVVERAVDDDWNKYNIVGKKWYLDGRIHRSSGPAVIEYGERTDVHKAYKMDLVPIGERFWIHGTSVEPRYYNTLIENLKSVRKHKTREKWVDYRHGVTNNSLGSIDNARKSKSNGKYTEAIGKGRIAATILGFASPKRFLQSVKRYNKV